MKALSVVLTARHLASFYGSLVIFSVIFSAHNVSAAASSEPWYQVELIAFARQTSDQQEQWFNTISLGYPLHWVELKDPTNVRVSEDGEAYGADHHIDLSHTPFHLLPTSEFKLAQQAVALTRNSHFRVLLHQAWRQPLTSKKNAPAILISGGRTYGDYHELAGSITLSRGQLTELNTRLWLTQFEINYGQAASDWPSLPESPASLKAKILARTQAKETQSTMSDGFNTWSLSTATANVDSSDINDEPKNDAYLPQRIVLLEEDRKMRSQEIYYIDHPLMGLLIQITPYTPDQQSSD